MRTAIANIWDLHAAGAAVAVTTSGLVGRDGSARLGRGCARQAGDRFEWFAPRLGSLVASRGNHVFHVGERIASFPVEDDPLTAPDLRLVARSARELAALAAEEGWALVALPRPGCGAGGLDWREVAPLLAPHLDERFLVVTLAPER